MDNVKIPDWRQEVSSLRWDRHSQLISIQAGTPEAGGWTTREVKRILRGLSGLNFV